MNACKAKLSVKVPTNPQDIVETYSCDIAEKECMLNDCEEGKRGQVVDIHVVNSSDSNSDTNSDNEIEVNFFRWQYVDRHATKARIALPLEDAIDYFRVTIMVIKNISILSYNSAWMGGGGGSGRINSTRGRVDHVSSDH